MKLGVDKQQDNVDTPGVIEDARDTKLKKNTGINKQECFFKSS